MTVRNDKRATLTTQLLQLKGYVQSQADANLENGTAVIQSAGLGVRKTAVRAQRVFAAKAGTVSGSAKLVAPSAGPRSFYEWQYSSDGGVTWVTSSSTVQAKTTVVGLKTGSTVLFKYRPVTKAGEENWSQPVAIVVQ